MSFPHRLMAKLRGDQALSLADQFLLSGLNFLVGVIAARLLGVEDFGFFALILIIVNFTAAAGEYLLTVPMMTLAGSRPRRSTAYFDAVLRLGVLASLGGALVVVAIVATMLFLRGDAVEATLLGATALLMFGQTALLMLRSVLFARRRSARGLTLDVLRLVLLTATLVLLADRGVPLGAATLFSLLGGSALVVALPDLARAFRSPLPAPLYRKLLARHWTFAKWMLLMMLLMLGQEQLLWVIAGIELGDAAVGALRVGQYLLGATHFVLHSLEYFMPRNAAEKLQRGGEASLRAYLTRQTGVYATALGVILLAVAVFAEPLLSFVFGAQYAEFAVYTRILALSYFLSTIRVIWERYFRTVERTDLLFWSFAVSSACALATIYPAMGIAGVAGVAWTVVLGQAVALSLMLGFVATGRAAGARLRVAPAE